jgi:hypothetical protein
MPRNVPAYLIIAGQPYLPEKRTPVDSKITPPALEGKYIFK